MHSNKASQPSIPSFTCREVPAGLDFAVDDGNYRFHCGRPPGTNILVAVFKHREAQSGVLYDTPDVTRMGSLVNHPMVLKNFGVLRPPENQHQLVTLVGKMAQAGASASRSAAEAPASPAFAGHRLG